MLLSDLSIRRPVLATVASLLLVALGVMSFMRLTLRELPNIDPPIVSVQVNYPGAAAAVVETRVTQVLEQAVSGIEGIDLIESRSVNGSSSVTLEFSLNREIEAAANDVRDAVSRVQGRLPPEVSLPVVAKVESDAEVIVWLSMISTTMDALELSDYAERYIVDRLSAIDGVAQVQVGGQQRYAMRVWLDRQALAARDLTVADVEQALRAENVELPAGRLESQERDFVLRVQRSYIAAEDFAMLPITKGDDGHLVRLGEVARVERASADRRAYFRGNGQPLLGLGIIKTSTANSLDVVRQVRNQLPALQQSMPGGTEILVSFDTTIFINAAVNRVYRTLIEAMILVIAVIYLFLGSLRAAIIPAVVVPVCLVSAFIGMYAFGASINLLTLLALVMCIGLVVDDAIVVLENCQRRADLGEPPLVAAARGTRQVAFAVIATTAVLVAVFVPVAFLEGNTGRLFRELSIALSAAVIISSLVALTLTPMMASKLVRPHTEPRGLNVWVHRQLSRLTDAYRRVLLRTVGHPLIFGLVLLATLGASYVLLQIVPQELAPPEDRGAFFIFIQGPEGAGFDYTVSQMEQVEQKLARYVGPGNPVDRVSTRVPGSFGASEEMHTGFAIALLSPWNERDIETGPLVEKIRADLAELPGVRALPRVSSGLVRTRGQPLQVVLGGPDYDELSVWRDRLLARMEDNPKLFAVDSDYKETQPQMRVEIDRSRAADLGVSVSEIGRTLETMMGARRATSFVEDGKEYDVILQAELADRATPTDLANLYVRSARTRQLIPLSNLVTLTEVAEPGSYNRFNRLRAITVTAGLTPDYPLGDALAWVQQVVAEELPQEAQIDYKGESREYLAAGGAVMLTFILALLVVYLVLAAQFESFIHPFVIMLTVPLAVLGALLGLWLAGNSLNLFSQIGIVMLVGLAAKNGILIVEFANQLRDEGRAVADAIIESAAVRLRPILMTSIATISGALPLVIASGPGSASRATIGIVIISGVAFSTLLSLFVVPSFYALLAPYTRAPGALAQKLERLERETPVVSGNA
jgi:multidrug efflux pump